MRKMPNVPKHYLDFVKSQPEIAAAYRCLGDAAMAAGPLDRRCVELIKVGASLGARLESAVKSHTRKAIEAGASREEVRHAVMAMITTLGFPTMMAGLKWVNDAIDSDEQT